jgi:hypothetical protein
MSKAEREAIIAQRVAARLEGKPIFLVGDIVRVNEQQAWAFPRSIFKGSPLGTICLIRRWGDLLDVLLDHYPHYAVGLHKTSVYLHSCDGRTRDQDGWWCDQDDLELVSRVEDEDEG